MTMVTRQKQRKSDQQSASYNGSKCRTEIRCNGETMVATGNTKEQKLSKKQLKRRTVLAM
jgi:hypothetical protein